MKKIALCTILLVIGILALAQSTQPCVIQQYNQKESKTPLEGVEIIVRDAGSAFSDESGKLTLVFATLKPGAKVELISAFKPGFELFNISDIGQWNISLDQRPFIIVMADSRFMANYKANLRQVSEENYKAKYHQALAEIASLKRKGQLKEEEYSQKINELNQNYQSDLANLEEYINQFTHIDLSEVSTEEQRILELVEKGKIDEAVKAYGAMDLNGKLRQARQRLAAVSTAKTQLEQKEVVLAQTLKELKEKQKREIVTLKLAGGKENFDKIEAILRENALADTTDLRSAWEYAQFALEQGLFHESERFFLLCLRNEQMDDAIHAHVLEELGTVYFNLGDFNKAEMYYLKALDIWTRLSDLFEESFLIDLSRIQHKLGDFYASIREYDLAQDYLLSALGIRAMLCLQDRKTYLEAAANTQNTLGTFYIDIKEFGEAELYLRMALNNYSQLLEENPSVNNRRSLAVVQNNLGNVLSQINKLSEAEDYYRKSLETDDQLFAYNPDAFRPDLLKTQMNLGLFYRNAHDYEQAELYLNKALENASILFNILPDTYRLDLAAAQDALAIVYHDTQRFDKAEDLILKAIDNYGHYYHKDAEIYARDMGLAQYYAGALYVNKREYPEAKKRFQEALVCYSQCRHPDVFHEEIAEIIHNLMGVCTYDGDNVVYDEILEKTLKQLELLYESYPVFQDLIVELRNRRGWRLLLKDDVEAAMSLFESTFLLDPKSSGRYLAEGLEAKSRIYAQEWKFNEALAAINRAISLDPENEEYYQWKGVVLFMTGDDKGALEMWNKVLEIYPEYLEWHNGTCPLYELLKGKGLI